MSTTNHNEPLQKLVRGLKRSQGQFRAFSARYSYVSQRDRLIEKLQASFPGVLAELQLNESITEIYTPIKEYLEDKQPDALMVVGWEFLRNTDELLVAMGNVREEFRKHCSLPMIFWVDGEISRKFTRLIPDFKNWASLTIFEPTTEELIDFIQQTSESVYQEVLDRGAGIFWEYSNLDVGECSYQELLDAKQELSNRASLTPELEAGLAFVLGRAADNSQQIALGYYQRSLQLWQQVNNPLRVAHTYYYLGLWWRSYGSRNRAEKHQAYEKACFYFKQLIEGFEAIERPDLVAKFINGWGSVLASLNRWDKLETLANKGIKLYQIYNYPFREARAYSYLAELELERSNYKQAKKFAQTAIKIFHKAVNKTSLFTPEEKEIRLDWERSAHLVRYLFYLAKAEKYLGQTESAIANLELVRDNTKPEYEPEFYIDALWELQDIYCQQKQYFQAFKLKQKRQKIEQEFGVQAFVGANRLRQRKRNTNPAFPNHTNGIQEIAASGRELDVKELVKRLSDNQCKLTVIHGPSGVGKSSTLQAGLIPVLKKKSINTQDVLVVLQRSYLNWVSELGKKLEKQLQNTQRLPVNSNEINSIEEIFYHLQNNDKSNILTVIIFDQFEEFFFQNIEPSQKYRFAKFLENCLNILSIKIIFSLREDYIHHLLELNRFANFEIINKDILSKNILYHLGNFTPEQAKLVIQQLTANSPFQINSELTEKLVEDLSQDLGKIRPIELQIVGAQLQRENIKTLEKYQELGNNPKGELVDRYLAEVVRDCGEENEKSALLVLWLLTDENNNRPLKTKAELLKESEFNLNNLDLVLNVLVGSGLVLWSRQKPAERYQLVHDYLVWFIRQRKGKEIPEELKAAQEKQRQAEEKRREEREKRLKLQKRLIIGSVAASLVMAVLTGGMIIFAFGQQRESRRAEKQTIIAQANESRALSISGQRLDGLMTAMEARQQQEDRKFQPTDEASKITNALRVAVYKQKQDDDFRELNRLQGHEDFVSSVAFTVDGEIIATASADKTVKLWNRQGKLLHTLTGHDNWVNAVAFSPDGETIATASRDNTVKLWNRQGKLLYTLTGHNNFVNAVAFSPDGETIATASDDKTVKLWNSQGKLLYTLTGHNNFVNSVAFSSDGETIATASADNTVKLWNRQGKLFQTLQGHEDSVYSVAFSSDTETIATASADNTVKLWNSQGKLFQTIKSHKNFVLSIALSPDGKIIASASADNTVKLWNLQGKLLQTLNGHENWVYGVAFSPDGETIATASADNTVKLWKFQKELLQTLNEHEDLVYRVAFSPNGETIATASADKTVKLWNPEGKLLQTLESHKDKVNDVAFSPDGETIASASDDKTVKLWNRQGKLLHTLESHKDKVNGIAFSPDGETIATTSDDKTVKLWNHQGKLLQTFNSNDGHKDKVNSVVFSPDGETIATTSDDKTVKLWNRQGKLLQTLEEHKHWVDGIAFSPDGKTIASASGDKTVILWNHQGKKLQILEGHKKSVWGVAFSPDGEMIATASRDKTVKLWNREGKLLQTLEGHRHFVYGVAFSPDGEIIASVSADETVKLWRNWRIEDLTTWGCEWLSDYLITHPHNLEKLKICQTYGRKKLASGTWIIEGEKLARESKEEPEKLKAAIIAFEKALKWNPDLNFNPKVVAESLAKAEKLMEEGTNLAKQGKIEEAIEKYQRAKKLDQKAFTPTLENLLPEAKAKSEASDAISDQGSELVREGKVEEAIASYQSAEKIDPTQIYPRDWDYLCWYGSLSKKAADVMFACEKAVALSPKDGLLFDGRGVARALTGDIKGAIADFQVFVDWTDDEEEKAKRQKWIKALQAGENPFTDEVLKELRE